jgi:hypothetical protein
MFPLAQFEPVTLLTTLNVEQPKVRDSTPKLQDVITAAKQNLCDTESRELGELLTEYGDVFTMDSDDYGRTDRVYHSIDTRVMNNRWKTYEMKRSWLHLEY